MVRKGVRRVFRGSRYWIGAEYEKARWRSVELAEMGHPVYVGRRVRIEHPHRVSLLDNVSLGSDVILDGYGGVVIGKNCIVADNVVIWTSMHNYDSPDLQSLPFDERLWGRPVTIDKHVWIGRGAVLGPGVHVGQGAVVGIGAVVTSNVSAFAVVRGNPAVEYKKRRYLNRYHELDASHALLRKTGILISRPKKDRDDA